MRRLKKYQGGKNIYFAPFSAFPQDKNRTPEWDDEEDKLFNDVENEKFFKEHSDSEYYSGYSKVKNSPYYTRVNPKTNKVEYAPGIIYQRNDDGTWTHYLLNNNQIEEIRHNGNRERGSLTRHVGYDGKGYVDQDKYNRIKQLGLDTNIIYAPDEQYDENFINSFNNTFNVNGYTVVYDGKFLSTFPNKRNAELFQKRLHGDDHSGTWTINDNNGHQFVIKAWQDRGGGSHLKFSGDVPEGLENGSLYDDGESNDEYINRMNKLLQKYNIQFKNNGGKLIPRKYYL